MDLSGFLEVTPVIVDNKKKERLTNLSFFYCVLNQENDPDILPSQPELKKAVLEYVPDLPVIVVLSV